MTLKSMSFHNVAIALVGRNYCRIHFCGMVKNEAVNRMKNGDLSEKKRPAMISKNKYLLIETSNITPETMNRQQRCREENTEKIREISKQYYQDNKKRLQKTDRN